MTSCSSEAVDFSILMVCVGNMCRSPMAEYMFRDYLQLKNPGLLTQLDIVSAGLGVPKYQLQAHRHTETVLLEKGIDCSKHRPQQLTHALLEQASLVFVMTSQLRMAVLQMKPEVCGKVFQLGEFSPEFPRDIADPVKEGVEFHRKTRDTIATGLQGLEQGLQFWVST